MKKIVAISAGLGMGLMLRWALCGLGGGTECVVLAVCAGIYTYMAIRGD